MTAYTSSQAGNWSASATWGGAGVPGIGDTASIGHAITVDVDTTVGTSGIAGTTDVTLTAAVNLTIANNVFFKVRSDLQLVGPIGGTAVGLILGQGSKYYFDGSVSNVSYKIKMGSAGNQAVRITGTGVAGNRFRFESLGTSAGGFTNGGGVAGQCSFYYGTFVNVAASAFNGNIGTTPTQDIRFCDFDAACGTISTGTMSATSSCLIENNVFRRTSGTGLNIVQGWAAGATKTLANNAFVGCQLSIPNWANGPTYVEGNAFSGNLCINQGGANGNNPTIIRNNAFRRLAAGDTQINVQEFSGNYIVGAASMGSNPHFMQFALVGGMTINVLDNVFEYEGTATDGDLMQPGGAPASAATINCLRNIGLPNGAGNSSGTIFTLAGAANESCTIDHNTYYVSGGGTGHTQLGETYTPGHAGLLASCRSNLAWSSSSTSAEDTFHQFGGTGTALTAGYATVAGHQGRWNLTGVHNTIFAGGLTTDDGVYVTVSSNPFIDKTRNMGKWDQVLGGVGTGANAWVEICKMNDDTGFNTSYTIAALYAWVRAGFVVTDSTLSAAGHDGITIGAMGYVASAPAGATGGRGRRSVPVFYHIINQLGAHLSWVKNLFARRRPWRDRNLAYG